MKKVYGIYFLILLILLGVFLYEYNKPAPVDWSPSLSSKSKEPFGQNILISHLDELFDTVAVTPLEIFETAMRWETGESEIFPLEGTDRTKHRTPKETVKTPVDSLVYHNTEPEALGERAASLEYEEEYSEEEYDESAYEGDSATYEEPERLVVTEKAKNSAYVFTTPFLGMDQTDFFSLFTYAGEGGTVLIATEKVSHELALNFQIKEEAGALSDSLNIDSLKIRNHELRVNPYYRDLFSKEKYRVSKEISSTYFILDADCVADTVLVNQSGFPVLIAYACGKGKIYLSSTPFLFTNHELLYGDRDLLNSILVLLPGNKVFWDDFYKTHQRTFTSSYANYKRGDGYVHSREYSSSTTRRSIGSEELKQNKKRQYGEEHSSPGQQSAGEAGEGFNSSEESSGEEESSQNDQSILSFITSNASLSWAWYTLLITLLLYMISSSRRRQKLIPVINKLQNTTIEFVQMISRLYFLKKDHKDIAIKKINYFQEYLRSKFYHKDLSLEDKNIELLAKRSNKKPEQVKRLFELINEVQSSETISAVKLHVLSQRINEFKS